MPKNAKMSRLPRFEIAKIAKISETVKIADTEIVRFQEKFKIWVVFGKKDGRFEKKLVFFSKSLNVVNLLQNAHQSVLFLKKVFRRNYEVCLAKKIRKL